MLHDTELIGTLTAGLVLAFVAGFVAIKLRLPPIVGYLIAGIAIGPFTPGYVGDTELAPQIAEIGVILLMFGVGIHFSVRDLLSVGRIAIPGAAGQIAGATALAIAASMLWGLSFGEGLVLGLAISVASTVVLLRALEDRNALTTSEGRIAVGWLIVEDLFTVMVLVFLPLVAVSLGGSLPDGDESTRPFAIEIGFALGKLALLTLVMVFIAARAIPWLLLQVARTGSRELFTLAVLAAALGIAFGSAYFFDVSLALGAFLAGLVVGQSEQSHQAASDALPLRDSFAVLFFVSVGMLFDPAILRDEPLRLIALVILIIIGKSIVAFLIVLAFGQGLRSALVVAAALAQIGEFSFILADVGRTYDLVSDDTNNLILGAALVSITLNPLMFLGIEPLERWVDRSERARRLVRRRAPEIVLIEEMHDHAVICGGGAVGQLVAAALDRHGIGYVIIEQDQNRVEDAQRRGLTSQFGDATKRGVLENVHLENARALIVATPEAGTSHEIVELARTINPNIAVVTRIRTQDERHAMRQQGIANEDIVISDIEVGLTIIRRSLIRLGVSDSAGLETLRLIRQSIDVPFEDDLQAGPEAPARPSTA